MIATKLVYKVTLKLIVSRARRCSIEVDISEQLQDVNYLVFAFCKKFPFWLVKV